MALTHILAQAGTPPDSVQTDATVTLRPVDGAPCPVSQALAAVAKITLEASLVK